LGEVAAVIYWFLRTGRGPETGPSAFWTDCEGADDDQGDAGAGAAGSGAADAALSKGEKEWVSAGGVAARGAAGIGNVGRTDCADDGFYDKDGVSHGAVGTEWDDQPRSARKDGAGDGVRPGVWTGVVAPVAGGSGDGAGGTDVVEEAVYAEGAAVRAAFSF